VWSSAERRVRKRPRGRPAAWRRSPRTRSRRCAAASRARRSPPASSLASATPSRPSRRSDACSPPGAAPTHQGARRQQLGGIVDHRDQRLPRVGDQGQPVMPAAVRMHAAPQPPAPRATRLVPVIKERERSRPVREAYLLCFNSQSVTSRGSGSSLPWGGGPSEGRAGCGGCGRAGSGRRCLTFNHRLVAPPSYPFS
jgi:hypothetical protein